ncbi:MAG: TonB-dependent receptor [Acidobacteria bacterium]|nr:TonB-dependent receptor [Acidobacteriota bacterium]
MSYRGSVSGNAILTLLLFLALPADALAQGAMGGINGVVRDGTGAGIPGASVTLTNQSTGAEYSTTTGPAGTYQILNLQAGDYTVFASASGFKRLGVTNIRVNAGTMVTQALSLEIGVVTERIEVSGQTQMVQTTSGEISSTVQIEQILELPMPSRDVFTLTNLVPGASIVGGVPSIGGGRPYGAGVYLDGVTNSRGGLAAQGIETNPPIDSMQEFKVEVNNMGAEHGRSAGGTVSAVTRSGGNELHGNLYEFLRNDKLDASGWNQTTKPKLRRNNFGGAIGGPIRRNKAFFFYNLDVTRQRSETVDTRDVGLPEFQQGDFSRATGAIGGQKQVIRIFDPMTGSGTFTSPVGTSPFPNNMIPKSRFDAVAVKVLAGNYIPAANREPTNTFNNSGNWRKNVARIEDSDVHIAKVDYSFSDRTRMFVRYILNSPEENLGLAAPDYGPADPNQRNDTTRRHSVALNMTHMFTPALLVNATVGFFRADFTRQSGDCCATNYAAKFGLTEPARAGGEVFPRFDFGGGLAPVTQLGVLNPANRRAVFNTFDYKFSLTKIQARHTLKFGFAHSRFQGNERFRPQPSGRFNFNGRWTQQYDASGRAVANTGIRFADFLLGRLNSADARLSGGIGKRIRYYAGYVQDDWRLTPNLTLNIGLRYETESPIFEVANRMNGFDRNAPSPLAGRNGIPAGAVGITIYPGLDGRGRYLWNWDKNNVAPRFGFAWRVLDADNLVLRGGYGLFFGNPYDLNTIQNIRNGFDTTYVLNHPVPYVLAQGIPAGALDDVPATERSASFGARGTRFESSSVEFIDPDRKTPYSHNANLNLQAQAGGWLFEAGVSANLGRHIPLGNININHIRTEDLPRLDPRHPNRATAYQLRPYQTLTSDQPTVTMVAANWGFSNAWLGTLKVERRFQKGFGMTLAYTYFSWIDTIPIGTTGVTFGDNDQVQNIYDYAGDRARSTNGVPHRVVIAPMYDLPFGRGRRLGGDWHRALNGIAGGWQVSTIATLRSGAPFGLEVLNGARDLLGDNAGSRVLRPDYAPGVSGREAMFASNKGQALTNGNTGLAWLNPAAFANPPQYTLGRVSRTIPGVLGPGLTDFEFMLAKNFRWGERRRAQFRWELFNMFNSPQFQLPAQVFGSAGFGEITEAGGRRIMQLGLKLYW